MGICGSSPEEEVVRLPGRRLALRDDRSPSRGIVRAPIASSPPERIAARTRARARDDVDERFVRRRSRFAPRSAPRDRSTRAPLIVPLASAR